MSVREKTFNMYEDQFYDWIAEVKFDEFATIKDRYEEDLEWYLGNLTDDEKNKLFDEFLTTIKEV